ncbi:hypothetical protein MA20_16120 [Bradyrhizobium japonicum]|uniref:Uncharacterized protein n=1 Tax=Bradyrhizobium japonicum TaxID=375 RepID=A0A0A3Y0G8_BRAJP|nr:hypothetical protein MA20_16120 [Bradyrhizobium japonicum]
MELLRLDAFVEVDVCVGDAFFVLQRVAENVTGRIDEEARRALLTVPQVMVMSLLLEHGQAASLVTADGHGWLALAYTVFIGRSAWGRNVAPRPQFGRPYRCDGAQDAARNPRRLAIRPDI